MRTLLIFLSVLLLAWLGHATPINPARRLVNRPTEAGDLYPRARRSPQDVKGGSPIKGRVLLTRTQPALRKGEYICGGRVCKLQPGEVPKGCNGICQYPI
ncbi:uncharacterized protein LOC135082634 [Ostrinia nubilalis]|uniref:uncharacterized protein LOC135082634 n=1 Tax=Ostrinia nubilalis TaxID=29057 RepID=UPI0030825035